ncbi:DJ-1/PfpI family protein [Myroides injenensis]|uniref:DJ-1/PfpI family protein n=1 Tax=Myroides injenensis TaxID=1183151 RepID=UPI000288F7D9|nr:DJ-1/PfpI family protein [Myroides injenensis]
MSQQTKELNVAFLIFNEVESLDLNGPLDVFVKANIILPNSYHNYLVSATSDIVITEGGTTFIAPQYTLDNCPKPNIIVLPGANPDIVLKYLDDEVFQNSYINWIKKHYEDGALLFTICTGCLLLGKTNILNGHNVTTHFMAQDLLQKYVPMCNVQKNTRYVDENKLLTTAGITAGIDAAIYLVKKQLGEEIGETITKIFEYKI